MEANKDYIGRVVYIDDVTHTGRCKIRVFGLFDTLDDENLPWFTQGTTTKFSSDGGGSIDIPKVGSIVKVKFSNNDFYSGEYYSLPMIDPRLVKEIEDDYEDTHVLLYDGDQELIIIYQKMTGLKIFHKDASIILTPTGSIQLKHANDRSVIEINDNNIYITTVDGGDGPTGDVNISAGNTVNIKANTIHLESDNIKLGSSGSDKHLAIAEEVGAALTKIVNVIATKLPIGAGVLEGEQWESLQTTKISCDAK